MFEKRENFVGPEWPGEPLHVVLYKNLHGGAFDRAGAVDGHVHAAADRHVGAEKNALFHRQESESNSKRCLDSARHDKQRRAEASCVSQNSL